MSGKGLFTDYIFNSYQHMKHNKKNGIKIVCTTNFTNQVHSGVPQTSDICISTVIFANPVHYSDSHLSYQRVYLREIEFAAEIIKHQKQLSASIKVVCFTYHFLEDQNYNSSSDLSNED